MPIDQSPLLSRATVDPASHRRVDDEWLAQAWAAPDTRVLVLGSAARSTSERADPTRQARALVTTGGTHQLVLTSPDVPMGDKSPAFALVNFIKTTLHAFTATLAVENERLVHDVPVNQINLTRRVQSEEPRDLDEHLEEVRRFARAVLLVGAPLPDAEDSRYRARIYRGMSMTV